MLLSRSVFLAFLSRDPNAPFAFNQDVTGHGAYLCTDPEGMTRDSILITKGIERYLGAWLNTCAAQLESSLVHVPKGTDIVKEYATGKNCNYLRKPI